MNYYFITGASRGIGKALVNCLQEDSNNHVTGISRTPVPDHAGYRHIILDLTDTAAVADFKFAALEDARKIVLINNAGAISEIKPLGRLDNNQVVRDFHINLVAPAILMNNFIAAYSSYEAEKIIVNVSSGAGKNPVDGWSTYCASKAGLDMFTRVADKEAVLGRYSGFRILSIAPGVVDTQMQEEIRSSNEADFSRIADFENYKKSGKLADAAEVACKYLYLINNPEKIPGVVFSVNDI